MSTKDKPMFIDTNWECPTEFPELEGAIAIDLETRDPQMKKRGPSWCFSGNNPEENGYIIGLCIADSAGFEAYYPVRHAPGGNLDPDIVFRWLKTQLEKPRDVVFANAVYDMGWLRKEGIELTNSTVHDVQLQAPLIDEHYLSYALDKIGENFIDDKKKQDMLYAAAESFGLKDVKANLWQLAPQYVGEYGQHDASLTLRLWQHFNPILDQQDLKDIYELERQLIPCLLDMRTRGVRVDLDKAEQMEKSLKKREAAAVKEIKNLTNIAVDPWVATSCAEALASEGIKCPLTEKTKAPSIQQPWLEVQANNGSKVAALILDARKAQKVHSTFIRNFVLEHHWKGRIHASYHPLRGERGGTISGRFSSSDPNLQQIPSRDKDPEFSIMCRSLYLPEEGEQWAALDYSAQEPRLTVHFAHLIGAEGAKEAVDKYNNDPETDYHQMVADLCGINRKEAKEINLGLAYGMGPAKLCKKLGLPTKMIEVKDWRTGLPKTIEVAGDEGDRLLKKYHENVPFIKQLDDFCKRRAYRRGYIKTLLKRRSRFMFHRDNPEDEKYQHTIREHEPDFHLVKKRRWDTHKALNRLVQGSAADQMKASMRDIYAQGKVPLVTVHDEIGLSVKDENEAKHWAKVMEDSTTISVPNKVDIEIGTNWGNSMEEG